MKKLHLIRFTSIAVFFGLSASAACSSDNSGGNTGGTAGTGGTSGKGGTGGKAGTGGTGGGTGGTTGGTGGKGGTGGGTGGTGGKGGTGGSTGGAGGTTGGTGGTGGSTGGTGGSTGGTGGATDGGCVNLTVKNYLNWCSVSVNGGTATTAAAQTVCVQPGSVNLSATAASNIFQLGTAPWHDTNGDTGSGDPGTVSGGTSTTTETVGTTADCVWVCCPFADDGGTGCPTTDQCP